MRIVTYNVLAAAYIQPSYYPDVEARWLRDRTPRIVERVRGVGAEVVCLQEVEREVAEALQRELPELRWHYLPKGKGKPDGCLTGASRLSAVREHHYTDGTGHVALLAEVAPGLVVANTHLRWSPDDSVATAQLAELAALGPDVICGDLNLEGASIEGWADPGAAFTAVANGRARKIDYVLVRGRRAAAEAPPDVNDHTPMPSAEEPSDHLPYVVSLQD